MAKNKIVNTSKHFNEIHGCSGDNITPGYKTWKRIRQRCSDKSLTSYGKKGISVCKRWDSFENFLADMGKRPLGDFTIDRIDGNKGYSPENCRWADRKTQQRNIKTNRLVEYNGKTMTVAELSEVVGIKYTTILNRLYRGLSVLEVINKPIKGYNK